MSPVNMKGNVRVHGVDVQVSFAGARITPDGRSAALMSSRTVKDFQTMGLHRQLLGQMYVDFPNITNFVFSGAANDASRKTRSRAQSLYFWVSNFKRTIDSLATVVVRCFMLPG